jgi:putative hemolysin
MLWPVSSEHAVSEKLGPPGSHWVNRAGLESMLRGEPFCLSYTVQWANGLYSGILVKVLAYLEVFLIPIFIVLNGFFAGAEIAIISASRGVLAERSRAGSRRATLALRLKDSPERFLPTVQIGITIVGASASAIGGMTLVGEFSQMFAPYMGPRSAGTLALLLVVGSISYLTLVIGELAPKNIAIKYSEQYAMALAVPMSILERLVSPVVRVLDVSTGIVLAPFGGKATEFDRVSRDELRHIILEGHRQGIYSATERALLASAIELINRTVKESTIPRHEVSTARPEATLGELREAVVGSPIPYVVLYDSQSDLVHGLVDWRDIFRGDPNDRALPLSQRVVYVPESAPLPKAIEQLQTARVHVGVVVNEYGEFEGLLSLTSLMQRQILAFTMPHGGHLGIRAVPGGWLVKGDVPLAVLREQLALPLEDNVFYTTLGGFVLEVVGHLPSVGDTFDLYGYRFTVRKMAGRRVDDVEIVHT